MHFLSLLSKQSGSGSPANSYTQTTSCNGINSGNFFMVAIVFIAIAIIVAFIYSTVKSTKESQQKQDRPIQDNSKENTKNLEEAQNLCKKIYLLDSADISKADGFVEALLTAEKYQTTPSEPANPDNSDS